MNAVIHPTGPESENTYWLRRGILVGILLLALGLIWWGLSSLFGGGSEEATVAATPQNPASLAEGNPASPSPSATPAASAGASATPSLGASASPSTTPSAKPSAKPTPTPTPTPSGPVACAAGDLDLSLGGERAPKIGSPVALKVELTATRACTLDLAATPVEVVVTSGSDRIWTTGHCSAWAPKGTAKLAAGKTYAATVTWSGKRSADGCKARPETLRPGTYRATAQLQGGASATLVMNAKG